MAEKKPVARKQSRSQRDKQGANGGTGENGHEDEVARYEQELARYLQERIKPNLNSGAIPLLARSIAKDIAHREHPNGGSEREATEDDPGAEADDEPTADADDPSAEADDEASAEADADPSAEADDDDSAEADDDPSAEADDDPSAEADDGAESEGPSDFEADMRELQAELGEDWILRFSVQGDDGWLTAEKNDGSQHVEAPTAAVLVEVVELLNQDGGRSS